MGKSARLQKKMKNCRQMKNELGIAQAAYEQGLALQREGKLGAARNRFAHALAIDPTMHQAKASIELIDDILSFEYKEMVNV